MTTALLLGANRMRLLRTARLAARPLCTATPPPPRAAALVIGSEVLSGKITDTNSAWLAKLLHARGVDLIRIVTVPDEPAVITSAVRELSALVGATGAVFTSGGIGPTHDDVTYDSVAAAFGRGCALHPPTVEAMRVHYSALGKEVNAARLRMATLPEGSVAHVTPGTWVPLAQVENVFILPGIPWLYKAMVEARCAAGFFAGPAATSMSVYTHVGEGDLAEALTAIAKAHPAVAIGSYPNVSTAAVKEYTTKLCLDGRDAAAVHAARAAVRAAIATFDALPSESS